MHSKLTKPPLSWLAPTGLQIYGSKEQLWYHTGPQYFKHRDRYWVLPHVFKITATPNSLYDTALGDKQVHEVLADSVYVVRDDASATQEYTRVLLYYANSGRWYYKSKETQHAWFVVEAVSGYGHNGACVVKDAMAPGYGKGADQSSLLDLLASAYGIAECASCGCTGCYTCKCEDGGCTFCSCGVCSEECDVCGCACDDCRCRHYRCSGCGCESYQARDLKSSLPRDLQRLIPKPAYTLGCSCKTTPWLNQKGDRILGYTRIEVCKYCQKLEPIFGNHDMLMELVSFYVISAAEHKAGGDKRIKPLAVAFNTRLAGRLANYLLLAALGEARHAVHRTRGTDFKRLSRLARVLVSNAISRGREGSYIGGLTILKHYTRLDVLRALREVFLLEWVGGFGGEAWSKCVDAAIDYETGTFNDILFIDHTVDLEHNGGWVFNKYYADAHMCGNYKHTHLYGGDHDNLIQSTYKIKTFLDDKQRKDVINIGDKYYECLAPEAQKALDYAYLATH